MEPIAPALLSHRDAARYLSISERKLDYLANDGDVPAVRIGRCRRYRLTDLQEFVANLPSSDSEVQQ